MKFSGMLLRGFIQAVGLALWFGLVIWLGVIDWRIGWYGWALFLLIATALMTAAIPLDERWRKNRKQRKRLKGRGFE
ncbi:hypothetical protein [Allopontixanthobacter sp.]|uniref:hypothetical protein n=1 Tax=Allopontixanthobacter sp. TaxID=2906452 RepID=UPI002ABBD304|nr:hypothetical protein [Allopontixanthobacter sp.]MDZ4307863.1 hypothetical protein [Allopontixanthobacter sp.]